MANGRLLRAKTLSVCLLLLFCQDRMFPRSLITLLAWGDSHLTLWSKTSQCSVFTNDSQDISLRNTPALIKLGFSHGKAWFNVFLETSGYESPLNPNTLSLGHGSAVCLSVSFFPLANDNSPRAFLCLTIHMPFVSELLPVSLLSLES